MPFRNLHSSAALPRAEISVRTSRSKAKSGRVDGSFFRAVPDNAHAPMFEDDVALNADGMISRFHIENGHADYEIRYVETERYLAEKQARRALFGRYRNPFTDDPSVAGVDRTLANTTPVWHAGRLFMTKEDGRGYEIIRTPLQTGANGDYTARSSRRRSPRTRGWTRSPASCSFSAMKRAACAVWI